MRDFCSRASVETSEHKFMTAINRMLFCVLLLVLSTVSTFAQTYRYARTGKSADAKTHPHFGIALMGGGADLDEAFRFLCAKADGGDFLILRAAGENDYNPYVSGLCKPNSVATLVIPDRASAQDPRVREIIGNAEAIFIAGGDQARYVNFWKGTPVDDALDQHIRAGKPIGGTSAGLAILGQFIYSAQQDKDTDQDLTSAEVLQNPYAPRVTLAKDFIDLPLLRNDLTDTHFAKRDRLGRSLGFLARIVQDNWSARPREIAIDERSAVLVEPDGKSRVIGPGRGAYFISITQRPDVCQAKQPLTMSNIRVHHAPGGQTFDLRSWSGPKGEDYTLAVGRGVIHSSKGDPY